MHGRELYESLGSPKKILAPMVEQSELAWRLLCLRHGADLCYSPMFHARNFNSSAKYRSDNFSTCPIDKPLIVQFCANDPNELLKAAKLIAPFCSAVDLNLGCPQEIARRGRYGSFLQDDWDLITSMINMVHTNLEIPITAKIRVFPDKEKTLAYARALLKAGASILAVHGRVREQRGHSTGLADWSQIRYLRDNLPSETVIFANGNILNSQDFSECMKATGADAVLSAEGSLYNPYIFHDPKLDWKLRHPMLNELAQEYHDIILENDLQNDVSVKKAIRPHLFKILRPFLSVHTDLRDLLATTSFYEFTNLTVFLNKMNSTFNDLKNNGTISSITDVEGTVIDDRSNYHHVPYWRAQCYLRPLP